MNVGLYSFRPMGPVKREKLAKMIIKENSNIGKIFIYSEDSSEQDESNKNELKGLKKLFLDYKKSKINLIAFENFNTLNKDTYTSNLIVKKLIQNRYDFYIIEEKINSNNSLDMMKINLYMYGAEEQKKYNDARSRMGQKIKNTIKK